jgi:hypothetical protein
MCIRFVSAIPIPETAASPRRGPARRARGRRHLATHRRPGDPPQDRSIGRAMVARIRGAASIKNNIRIRIDAKFA